MRHQNSTACLQKVGTHTKHFICVSWPSFCVSKLVQEVERVIHLLKGWWLDPLLLYSACQVSLGKILNSNSYPYTAELVVWTLLWSTWVVNTDHCCWFFFCCCFHQATQETFFFVYIVGLYYCEGWLWFLVSYCYLLMQQISHVIDIYGENV